jgi:hypothetical protein
MILEGIVTTLNPDGAVHIAPMGPDIDEQSACLVLMPFQTSQTYQNLARHPEGILHVTDDALLLAQAAIGAVDPMPAIAPAKHVQGFYLLGCCRYLEFRIEASDSSRPRARMEARILRQERIRDFFGFNRGKHAVVEAAILATRLHLFPLEEVAREFDRLEVLVKKTGGSAEHQAFAILRAHLGRTISERTLLSPGHPAEAPLATSQEKRA